MEFIDTLAGAGTKESGTDIQDRAKATLISALGMSMKATLIKEIAVDLAH